MSDTTLRFDLLANDRASKVFDSVGRAASDTESRFSKVGRGLVTVGKLAGKGALLFGGLAAAGGLMGLKTAAGMEQARISFTTMLGSGQKADKFLKQLADFAAKTPFEFPELQTAASSLISAGFEAKKVIPIMTTLGDVTSGMGTGAEGVQRATVALQQMSAAGKITGEDLNQLRDAGVPVFDLLASATGKSKEAISQLAQQGKLGKKEMQQLFDALGSGKGLERFSGLMEKQSHSLTGLWSTFQDTLGMGLAKAIEPALPAIKTALGKITGAVGTALAALPGIVDNVKDFAGPIIQKIRDALPGIKTAVGEWASAVANFADGVVVKVEPIISAVRTALDSGDWGPVGASLGSALAEAIKGAGSAIGQMTEALGSLLAKIDFVGLGIAMGKQAPAVVVGFAAGLINFDMGGLLKGLWNNWQEILLAGIVLFLAPAKVVGKVGEMLAKIPFVGRLLEWGLNAIKGFVDKVGGAIGEGISSLGSSFLSGFRRVFPGIGSAFADGLRVLPTRIGVAAIEVADKAVEMMVGLRGAITGKIDNIAAAAGEVVAKIVRAFADIGAKGLSIGMDLVRGIINGIKALAGEAMAAAARLASDAINAIKSKLHIGSPSKVTYELGEFFAQGFQGGIKSKTKAALSAVSALVERSVDKLRDLRSQAEQITSGVASAMTGALDVGSLGGVGEDGIKLNVTDQLADFASQARQFSQALAQAAAKGLNSDLIAKVANLGPTQGLTAAQALAAMDEAQVASANASLDAVAKYADKLGQTVLTTTSLPEDIARQEGMLATLQAIQKDLRENPGNITFQVNDATDPDKVVQAIRKWLRQHGKKVKDLD